jgi:probable phosphoglycerate mutase
MPTVVLVRHGQTDLSRSDYFCGTTDPPLNAIGREMADAVAARTARDTWVALYASPLLRARQTAEAVARRTGQQVRIEAGLREIAYGEWEAQRAADVRRTDRARYDAWAASPGAVAPPGGETGEAIAARARPVIEAIVRRHPDGTVLVVSHKATIRIVICCVLGIDLNLFRTRIGAPVASFAAIDFRETGPLVTLLGDTSHLPAHLRDAGGT